MLLDPIEYPRWMRLAEKKRSTYFPYFRNKSGWNIHLDGHLARAKKSIGTISRLLPISLWVFS